MYITVCIILIHVIGYTQKNVNPDEKGELYDRKRTEEFNQSGFA